MQIKTNITIFGGTGDLTFRKLLPALYTMDTMGKLAGARIVIIGRRDFSDQSYRQKAREWVERFSRLPFRAEAFDLFAEKIFYHRMDFADLSAYKGLDAYFAKDEIDEHIFYYAVAPAFFCTITEGIEQVRGTKNSRMILEKPFGEDLEAANRLNQKLEAHFGADNVYRIDHYLGKEMVRNIQAIRFTNPIFGEVWNARYIESVQISALEDLGVETRGGYYDDSGALKDMVQNHLLQILSIIAMEKPQDNSPKGLHDAQLEVFRALRRVDSVTVEDTLVLGQYEGYRSEPKVRPDSRTETFASLCLYIDNVRWAGTPFHIRTGKKTGKREIEVAIVFRKPAPDLEPNILIIKIQPTEGVYLQFNIKRPGETDEITQAKLDFCQNCNLVHHLNTPEAYERLLTACMMGEGSWFSQWDQIEICWQYISRLKALYDDRALPLYEYVAGTPGPREAEKLLRGAYLGWVQDKIED